MILTFPHKKKRSKIQIYIFVVSCRILCTDRYTKYRIASKMYHNKKFINYHIKCRTACICIYISVYVMYVKRDDKNTKPCSSNI